MRKLVVEGTLEAIMQKGSFEETDVIKQAQALCNSLNTN